MPGIGAINPMGGMSAMSSMYQTSAANRRQNEQTPEINETTRPAEQDELAATQIQPAAEPRMPLPGQAEELPRVDALDNASETLAQMRVQFSDPADAAFDRFKADAEAPVQGAGQTPPPPPPEGGEPPMGGADRMTPPPEAGEPAANGAGRPLPPPEDGAAPMQAPNGIADQSERIPFATAAAGIV